MLYLVNVLKSKYCVIIFAMAFIISYFLVPEKIFYEWYTLLGIAFMIAFSLSLTCIVRNVKERIMLTKTYESSVASIIATAVGLTALQACGIGAPVCGSMVGLGFLSIFFPTVFNNFLYDYGLYVVLFSISIQFIALYFMKCFKRVSP